MKKTLVISLAMAIIFALAPLAFAEDDQVAISDAVATGTSDSDATATVGAIDNDADANSDSSAIVDGVAADSTSSSDNSVVIEDLREFPRAIQVQFPGLIQAPNLAKAGSNVRQIETILPFLSELTPEQADNLSETPNWFGDGVSILENYFGDEVAVEYRSATITIIGVKEGESVTASNLGFLIGNAEKNEVETIDLIGALAYSAWEHGGNTLVLTAEGFERVAEALGYGLGGSYVKATESTASAGGTGISWASASNEDYPFIQGAVLRK